MSENIALLFLENGFRVGIYTNGYCVEKLKHFLNITQKYHYYVAISLDGIGDMHNNFRGGDSFDRVISCLDELKKYDNVEVLIETAVSKMNIDNIKEIMDYVENKYPRPKFEHAKFIISPVNDCEYAFRTSEVLKLKSDNSFLFDEYFSKTNYKGMHYRKKPQYRCLGGVINGVLTADGKVKSCPIAQDDAFIMGNINKRSLSGIWEFPGGESREFRNEYLKNSDECKKCKFKKKCGNKNCRVEAHALTGDWKRNKPYTCIVVKDSM